MQSKHTRRLAALAAATTLAVGGLAVADSSPAFAGCGASIEVHNLTNSSITVDWSDSDARTSTVVLGQRIAGTWASLASGTSTIAAGATGSKAVTLNLSCSIDRQYRIEINQNGNSWFEYFPSSSTWTRDISPHIHAD